MTFLFLFFLFFVLEFSSFKTGVSSPAESKKTIFLSLYSSNSGYFILNPSVLIEYPEGNSNFDILERRKDFPLFEFPITPILIILEFLYLL